VAKPVYRELTKAPKKPARVPTEKALVEAILASPDDDAPRIVYADWLTERGDPRGEFITVQLALAKRPTDALRAREAELLKKHKKAWVGRFGGTKVEYGSTERTWTKTNPTKWEFVRGFVDWCSMKSVDFARNAPALLEAEPLRRAHLTDRGIDNLVDVPEIRALRELDLRRVRVKTSMTDLVEAACFTGLEVLGLEMCGLGQKTMRELVKAEPKRLPKLFALELAHNQLGSVGALMLSFAPILAQIRWLDLSNNEIGSDGAEALAKSPHLDRIEHLDVFANELGSGLAILKKRFGKRLVHTAAGDRPAPHTFR